MSATPFPTLTEAEVRTRLLELENAISWETTCLNCARLLDDSYNLYARAEQAEVALRAQEEVVIRAHALLDEEPLLLSLIRLACAPITMAKFVVAAARSKL